MTERDWDIPRKKYKRRGHYISVHFGWNRLKVSDSEQVKPKDIMIASVPRFWL
jgi:hypothetical protein